MLFLSRGRGMWFGFGFCDEPGMTPQADMMIEVEVVFRARSQAERTIMSAPPRVDQMPRDREGGEQHRIQIEPVIIRVAPVHGIIIPARPCQNDHGDQNGKNDGLPERNPVAAGTVLHVREAIRRNGNRSGDFRHVVFVPSNKKTGQGGHGSSEDPERKHNKRQRNQYDLAQQGKIRDTIIHISADRRDRRSEIYRSQRRGKDQPGDPPRANDGAQPSNRKMV